jgi:hypothetical protein
MRPVDENERGRPTHREDLNEVQELGSVPGFRFLRVPDVAKEARENLLPRDGAVGELGLGVVPVQHDADRFRVGKEAPDEAHEQGRELRGV